MPFQIIRNDLTKMEVDEIVNATDEHLSGSGGTERAVCPFNISVCFSFKLFKQSKQHYDRYNHQDNLCKD